MDVTETKTTNEDHRPLSQWLRDEIKLTVPRYGLVGAAFVAAALLLVAID
ncbi:hypothetical protein [uncultured Algimonas sp.]|nr:hypothetical protein [uncultured Algimonas sp.]